MNKPFKTSEVVLLSLLCVFSLISCTKSPDAVTDIVFTNVSQGEIAMSYPDNPMIIRYKVGEDVEEN